MPDSVMGILLQAYKFTEYIIGLRALSSEIFKRITITFKLKKRLLCYIFAKKSHKNLSGFSPLLCCNAVYQS